MSVQVVFLLVRVVVIFTHCTPHRVAQVVRVSHLIHCERLSSTLSSPFHPTSSSHSPSISRSSCCPSTSTRIRSNTVCSANKEMGSTDESYFPTMCKERCIVQRMWKCAACVTVGVLCWAVQLIYCPIGSNTIAKKLPSKIQRLPCSLVTTSLRRSMHLQEANWLQMLSKVLHARSRHSFEFESSRCPVYQADRRTPTCF